MGDIIADYFISPIFERSGYNAVNTVIYAVIAIISVYAIWRVLKARDFDFGSRGFLYAAGAFVLLGSTCRVVTDLSDSGAMAYLAASGSPLAPIYQPVLASGIFSYGYLTVTPGIYLVTALLFLCALGIGIVMKKEYFAACAGILLWLPCALLLLPFAKYFYFTGMVAVIATLGALACFEILKRFAKMKLTIYEQLAIFGQALDGAATFVVIDIFSKEAGKSYFEQHVLSAGIGELTPLGFFLFFMVKCCLATAIVYFLRKEKIDPKDAALILIVVAIMGFAPGIRDLLRMLAGT